MNNIVEYEACILGLETALELGIRQMKAFELLVWRFDGLRYTRLPREQNQFFDPLATLTSSMDLSIDVIIHPLLIESRFGTYLEAATTKDRRALRHLATRFVICGETLYRRSADGMLILCLDQTSADQAMRKGIDIIGKISPKSSSGHEFILVAIDYFTKWVEVASYARLTFARVVSFIISHIICRYRVSYELILDRGVHFRAEVDTLLQKYGVRHHRSSAYMP
ncbi:hypothetical protein CK203_023343 [Vitis vinifera]|uniref:Integrase catalytic domain-containing protein n=1 Tax=Vitis vinifera TaxID=29760 RepID=A0A438J6K4_VITVI|nr:hypothetical protein CK203_023343 [Vitis vinifera]